MIFTYSDGNEQDINRKVNRGWIPGRVDYLEIEGLRKDNERAPERINNENTKDGKGYGRALVPGFRGIEYLPPGGR